MPKKEKKTDVKSDVIKKVVSQALGKKVRLSMDSIVNITEDYNEYVLLEEVNFMTISGTARQTKNNENVSGDNFAVQDYMSNMRFLLWYVYCKLHELSDRGTWYGSSGQRNNSSCLF